MFQSLTFPSILPSEPQKISKTENSVGPIHRACRQTEESSVELQLQHFKELAQAWIFSLCHKDIPYQQIGEEHIVKTC